MGFDDIVNLVIILNPKTLYNLSQLAGRTGRASMHGKVVIIYSEAKYTKLIVQLIHFLAIQMQKWEALLPELPQKAIKPAVELPAKVINVKEKNIAVRLLESVSMTVNVVSPV